MSQENVETLREAYAEIALGYYAPFRDLLDPGIVYWLRPEDPEPGPHRGRDAVLGVVDWARMVRQNPQWLAGDGVHVNADGYRARAHAIARSMRRCR